MKECIQIRTELDALWPTTHLCNGIVSLSLVPDLGGRIMALGLAEDNMLYVNPRHQHRPEAPPSANLWRNYGGSKVWVAPQGWSSDEEWPGPPDPVFDSGPYRFRVSSDGQAASAFLESQHDERSGVTLERQIEMSAGTSILRLRHRMRNTSKRRVRWSIWQVTQVDAANGLDVFMRARGLHKVYGNEPYRGMEWDSDNKRLHLQYEDRVAKFAVDADQGWFVSLDKNRGIALCETFPITPGADYPDGSPVAFWISGKGTYTLHEDAFDASDPVNGCGPHIETEIMGPLTQLSPGESCALDVTWGMAAVRADEIISASDCGVISRRLAVAAGTPARVTGSFGVFHEAELQLVAYDRSASVLGRFAMGSVTPLRPVLLDTSVQMPKETARCSLLLLDQDNLIVGKLDHVYLH